MPHNEKLAQELHKAHDAANEARAAVHAEIDDVLEDHFLARAFARLVGLQSKLAAAIFEDISAQDAHKAASNAYLEALSVKAGDK